MGVNAGEADPVGLADADADAENIGQTRLAIGRNDCEFATLQRVILTMVAEGRVPENKQSRRIYLDELRRLKSTPFPEKWQFSTVMP
jgi:hypothetical protein